MRKSFGITAWTILKVFVLTAVIGISYLFISRGLLITLAPWPILQNLLIGFVAVALIIAEGAELYIQLRKFNFAIQHCAD